MAQQSGGGAALRSRQGAHAREDALPATVRVALAATPDERGSLELVRPVLERLNARFTRSVRFAVADATGVDAANDRYRAGKAERSDSDVILLFAWNRSSDEFADLLGGARKARYAVVLRRSDPVELDLADAERVRCALADRERLDELLKQYEDHIRVVHFSGNPSQTLELELSRAVSALGIGVGPIDLRPRPAVNHLPRPRLLRLLPDTAGHVVLLEAPFGSGKSVLAAQWANSLEADGHRVVWAAPGDGGSTAAARLALSLGIAPTTPEPLVAEKLWQEPSVVVIEEPDPADGLDWLLDAPSGFVLLTSREPFTSRAIEVLQNRGRLTRLGASDLAFTREEVSELAGDDRRARQLHTTTRGWALPTHVAALTGAAPEPAALAVGIRGSLKEDAWQELLFLAALPHLPLSASVPETDVLRDAGFVQALGNAYRLHDWYRELLLGRHREDAAQAVRSRGHRLPLELRGEAYATIADADGLTQVLEAAAEAELWQTSAHRMVAWAKRAKRGGYRMAWALGAAHRVLGNYQEAVERLERALSQPGLGPDELLGIAREAFVPYAATTPERGVALVHRAEAWLAEASPEIAARFLGNAAVLYALRGEFEEAVTLGRRALDLYPGASTYRVASEVNLALFEWNLTGDIDARIRAQEETLEDVAATYPAQSLGQARDLGMFHLWLGRIAKARGYLQRAAAGEDAQPATASMAQAALAFIDRDRKRLDGLLERARLFSDSEVADVTAMFAIRLALEEGDLGAVQAAWDAGPLGPFATSAYARFLNAEGRTDEALELLDQHADDDRIIRLHLRSARYLLTGDAADLTAFLDATTAGYRLLAHFLPLDVLPDEPEYGAHYPMVELLRTGRADAVAARANEIPPLRIDVLSAFRAQLLGEELAVTRRHQELLVAMLLGAGRAQLGEALWPGAGAAKQRNNLNVQLALLRKLLEPWEFPTYLNESGLQRVESDYARLCAALQRGDPAEVLKLYRGPLTPDIDLPLIDEERSRLHEAVVGALFEAGDETRETEPYLLRVLELEPLHEEALQMLLRGLLRRGRRREAMERYRKFADRLQAELGLEPLPATSGLLR